MTRRTDIDSEGEVERWVRRSEAAHQMFVEAYEKAEQLRVIRQGAMTIAVRHGATQRQLAERLSISQPAVSGILRRRPPKR